MDRVYDESFVNELNAALPTMDRETIVIHYREVARSFVAQPDPKLFRKYQPNDLIDIDQSVRWNQEEKEKRNAAYEAEWSRLHALKNTFLNNAEQRIIEVLADEYDFSIDQASIVWYFSWENHHSEGIRSVADYFGEYAEFIIEFMKQPSKKKA